LFSLFSNQVFAQQTTTPSSLGIVLTSFTPFHYKDEGGYTVIIGEVENTKNFSVTAVKILGLFYDDSSEQPLEAKIGTTIVDVIPPFEKVAYIIKSPNPNASITNVSVKLQGFNSAPPKNEELSIESEISELGKQIKITGRLTNNSSEEASQTKIHLVFYDTFQPPRIIWISTIDLVVAIKGGSSADFEFNEKFNQRSIGYKIFAESDNSYSNIQNVEITPTEPTPEPEPEPTPPLGTARHIATVQWLEPNYPPNTNGVLRVVEPDMNLNSGFVDSFIVDVWSTSDAGGIDLTVTETGVNTNTFEGTVFFHTTAESSGHTLRVSDGDIATAEYQDSTLPAPFTAGDELDIAATVFIGNTPQPLGNIFFTNPNVVDSSGNPVISVLVGERVVFSAFIDNDRSTELPFAFGIVITNDVSAFEKVAWITGSLTPGQTFSPALSWTPDTPGVYTISLELWNNPNERDLLAQPLTLELEVLQFPKPIPPPPGVDIIPPELLIPADMIITGNDPDGTKVTYSVKAIDNFDQILNPKCDPPSGSIFSVGVTIVRCSVTDSSGNTDTDSFKVLVKFSEFVVPEWVKDVAGFWCNDEIDDAAFVQAIQYLITSEVLIVPPTESGGDDSEEPNELPSWIKNTACWWSQGAITDGDFVNGIQFLIEQGIIKV